jgi:hypothetical protein
MTLPRTLLVLLALALPCAAFAGDGPRIFIDGQVFSGFEYLSAEGGDGDATFNEFVVNRAELGLAAEHTAGRATFGGFFRAEAVRAANPESVVGVAGNSLVMRVKAAFGAGRYDLGVGALEARLGLVLDPWIELVEARYDLRGASPLLAERGDFFDTSDLGATVSFDAPWLRVVVGAQNGEGRNEVEQNEGKNLIVAARGRVVRLDGLEAEVDLHAGYRWGSLGVGEARAHRVVGGATFHAPAYGGGVEYVMASGYADRGDVDADGLGVWAHGAIVPEWLGLLARFDRLNANADADDATVMRILGGLYLDPVGHDPMGRLRLYALYVQDTYGDDAGSVPGVPGASSAQTIILRVELRGGLDITPGRAQPTEANP